MSMAAMVAGSAKVMKVTGVTAGNKITFNGDVQPTTIVAVLAFITASGAVATKHLLAETTDYTLDTFNTQLKCVTDQSANTLLVIYK